MARAARFAPTLVALAAAAQPLACERAPSPTGDSPRASEVAAPEPPASGAASADAAPSSTADVGARAAASTPPAAFEAVAPPRALLARLPVPRPIDPPGPVDAALDREWATRLASAPITALRRNRGGATMTFVIRFGDGARAVWKPEQSHGASNFRAEIAAYHVDRWLGLHRTAVVVGRRLPRALVRSHLVATGASEGELRRFDAEVRDADGQVAGATIAWHARPLVGAEPARGWEREPGSASERRLELADLVLFDALIDNDDRWSGGNVLTLGEEGPLVFLDNAAGFVSTRDPSSRPPLARLRRSCVVREATLAALARVGPAADAGERLGALLHRSLAGDPLAPVLSRAHLAALDRRVALVLDHFARCRADGGLDGSIPADATAPDSRDGGAHGADAARSSSSAE